MKERIQYLDNAKGLLIILMVLGHVFEKGPINQYIYSFHMPAFFIISGILFNYSSSLKKSFTIAVKNKIYTLLVPYVFFEVLGVIRDIIEYGMLLNVKGYIYQSLVMDCNNGPDWFLYALFIDEILFIIIHKIIAKRIIALPISIVTGCLMIIFRYQLHIAGSVGIGFLFVVFGYYAGFLFTREVNNVSNMCMAFALVSSIVITIINGKVDLGFWQFGNPILYVLGSIIGTYFVIEISKHLSSNILTLFGKNTLTILGTHQLIILPIRFYTGILDFTLAIGIVVILIVLALEIFIISIFNTYVPFLIGKNNTNETIEKYVKKVFKA